MDEANAARQESEADAKNALRRRQLLQAWSAAFTSLLGVVTVAGILTLYYSRLRPSGDVYLDEAARLTKLNEEQNAQLRLTIERMQEMQESVDKLSHAQPPTLQVAKLTAEVNTLQSQMKELDDAIGLYPAKALAVPLLQKDVDDFKDTYRRDIETTQGEINRVYDQNKWFIGLMFTLALGVVSLAVTNLVQVFKR